MRNIPDRTRGSVASLRKGIDLLFLFSEAEPVLGVQQIAIRLGLPKSTTYRFVGTLRQARTLKRFTPTTPVSPAAVKRALQEVRRAGHAVSLQEVTPGACGISAPILGPTGLAIASVGVSGPMQRLTEQKRPALVEPIRKAAGEIMLIVRQHPTGAPATAPLPQPAPSR